jgi:TRAP-type uncharacterized transport system fused permease subunit
MNQQVRNYLFMLSGLMVISGAILYITHWFYSPYFFAAGAAGITICFMTTPYQGLNFRLRRLQRINVMAGVSLIVSSVFMFRRQMEWVVFLLITALLILYTSFVGPRSDE